MKILFLGPVFSGQTSLMRAKALERLGHQVCSVDTVTPWRRGSWIARQCQRRLQRGPIINGINRSVIQAAADFRPDMLWGEKQEYLHPDTLLKLKKSGTKLIHFTPDPYFSLDWKRTRLMDQAISLFDVLVYCKSYEHSAYKKLGKPLVYMPLGFCDEVHRPLPSNDAKWHCRLGFLGGWEPRRQEMLAPLAAQGLDLKIWGVYWDHVRDGKWSLKRHLIAKQLDGEKSFKLKKDECLAKCLQGGEVYADDYARALTGSAISIGFLRKVCPDQHTTRTFEIPACGSMLLADRTPDHQAFFEEGKEAEFFDCKEELSEKAMFYAVNEKARILIAQAGLVRARQSGYSYRERLRTALGEIESHFKI